MCELHTLATGALAERVLSQHGTPGLRQSRHVPSPSPHHQPPAVGDSNLPGTQVSHNWQILLPNNRPSSFHLSTFLIVCLFLNALICSIVSISIFDTLFSLLSSFEDQRILL